MAVELFKIVARPPLPHAKKLDDGERDADDGHDHAEADLQHQIGGGSED